MGSASMFPDSAVRLSPAIVVVGFDRPNSLKRLLGSLSQAAYPQSPVPLIISLDRSSRTDELVEIANAFQWVAGPKVVRTFEERQGLKSHVLQCGDLSAEYEAVILLEDDVVVAPGFYVFAVASLSYYASDSRVAGVSLYSHEINESARRYFTPVRGDGDVFFAQFSCTWGQCWSREQWESFRTWFREGDGDLKSRADVPAYVTRWPETSWAKFFVHYMVERDLYYVIPYVAYSTNSGDAGQHNQVGSNAYQVPLSMGIKPPRLLPQEGGIHYDAHFAPVGLARAIGMQDGSVVFDLYGTRESFAGFDFVVSTRALPFYVASSFGLQVRPLEMNVLQSIPGDAIRLYDLRKSAKVAAFPREIPLAWIGYEHRTLAWREAMRIGLQGLWAAILNRVSIGPFRRFNARLLLWMDSKLGKMLSLD